MVIGESGWEGNYKLQKSMASILRFLIQQYDCLFTLRPRDL